MPTPEQSNAAMRTIAELQHAYEQGDIGLPPGAEWVDTALAYLEHGDVWEGPEARDLLEGYGILVPPPPPPPSLDEAMDIPEWWDGFKAWAAGPTALCGENPDFVDAVRNQSMDPQAIYDTFISVSADTQVNIPSTMRAPIDTAFAGGEAQGHDVFAAAYAEIVRVMRMDSWGKYLATLK